MLLKGSVLSKNINKILKQKIKTLPTPPGLGIILVGDKSDSKVYVEAKKKACSKVGIKS